LKNIFLNILGNINIFLELTENFQTSSAIIKIENKNKGETKMHVQENFVMVFARIENKWRNL
jgi:hypothetical protein